MSRRRVEIGEQPAEQVVEGASVGGAERLEQPLFIGEVRREGSVHECAALAGQPDGRAAPVFGIRAAFDEAGGSEPVEPLS